MGCCDSHLASPEPPLSPPSKHCMALITPAEPLTYSNETNSIESLDLKLNDLLASYEEKIGLISSHRFLPSSKSQRLPPIQSNSADSCLGTGESGSESYSSQ